MDNPDLVDRRPRLPNSNLIPRQIGALKPKLHIPSPSRIRTPVKLTSATAGGSESARTMSRETPGVSRLATATPLRVPHPIPNARVLDLPPLKKRKIGDGTQERERQKKANTELKREAEGLPGIEIETSGSIMARAAGLQWAKAKEAEKERQRQVELDKAKRRAEREKEPQRMAPPPAPSADKTTAPTSSSSSSSSRRKSNKSTERRQSTSASTSTHRMEHRPPTSTGISWTSLPAHKARSTSSASVEPPNQQHAPPAAAESISSASTRLKASKQADPNMPAAKVGERSGPPTETTPQHPSPASSGSKPAEEHIPSFSSTPIALSSLLDSPPRSLPKNNSSSSHNVAHVNVVPASAPTPAPTALAMPSEQPPFQVLTASPQRPAHGDLSAVHTGMLNDGDQDHPLGEPIIRTLASRREPLPGWRRAKAGENASFFYREATKYNGQTVQYLLVPQTGSVGLNGSVDAGGTQAETSEDRQQDTRASGEDRAGAVQEGERIEGDGHREASRADAMDESLDNANALYHNANSINKGKGKEQQPPNSHGDQSGHDLKLLEILTRLVENVQRVGKDVSRIKDVLGVEDGDGDGSTDDGRSKASTSQVTPLSRWRRGRNQENVSALQNPEPEREVIDVDAFDAAETRLRQQGKLKQMERKSVLSRLKSIEMDMAEWTERMRDPEADMEIAAAVEAPVQVEKETEEQIPEEDAQIQNDEQEVQHHTDMAVDVQEQASTPIPTPKITRDVATSPPPQPRHEPQHEPQHEPPPQPQEQTPPPPKFQPPPQLSATYPFTFTWPQGSVVDIHIVDPDANSGIEATGALSADALQQQESLPMVRIRGTGLMGLRLLEMVQAIVGGDRQESAKKRSIEEVEVEVDDEAKKGSEEETVEVEVKEVKNDALEQVSPGEDEDESRSQAAQDEPPTEMIQPDETELSTRNEDEWNGIDREEAEGEHQGVVHDAVATVADTVVSEDVRVNTDPDKHSSVVADETPEADGNTGVEVGEDLNADNSNAEVCLVSDPVATVTTSDPVDHNMGVEDEGLLESPPNPSAESQEAVGGLSADEDVTNHVASHEDVISKDENNRRPSVANLASIIASPRTAVEVDAGTRATSSLSDDTINGDPFLINHYSSTLSRESYRDENQNEKERITNQPTPPLKPTTTPKMNFGSPEIPFVKPSFLSTVDWTRTTPSKVTPTPLKSVASPPELAPGLTPIPHPDVRILRSGRATPTKSPLPAVRNEPRTPTKLAPMRRSTAQSMSPKDAAERAIQGLLYAQACSPARDYTLPDGNLKLSTVPTVEVRQQSSELPPATPGSETPEETSLRKSYTLPAPSEGTVAALRQQALGHPFVYAGIGLELGLGSLEERAVERGNQDADLANTKDITEDAIMSDEESVIQEDQEKFDVAQTIAEPMAIQTPQGTNTDSPSIPAATLTTSVSNYSALTPLPTSRASSFSATPPAPLSPAIPSVDQNTEKPSHMSQSELSDSADKSTGRATSSKPVESPKIIPTASNAVTSNIMEQDIIMQPVHAPHPLATLEFPGSAAYFSASQSTEDEDLVQALVTEGISSSPIKLLDMTTHHAKSDQPEFNMAEDIADISNDIVEDVQTTPKARTTRAPSEHVTSSCSPHVMDNYYDISMQAIPDSEHQLEAPQQSPAAGPSSVQNQTKSNPTDSPSLTATAFLQAKQERERSPQLPASAMAKSTEYIYIPSSPEKSPEKNQATSRPTRKSGTQRSLNKKAADRGKRKRSPSVISISSDDEPAQPTSSRVSKAKTNEKRAVSMGNVPSSHTSTAKTVEPPERKDIPPPQTKLNSSALHVFSTPPPVSNNLFTKDLSPITDLSYQSDACGDAAKTISTTQQKPQPEEPSATQESPFNFEKHSAHIASDDEDDIIVVKKKRNVSGVSAAATDDGSVAGGSAPNPTKKSLLVVGKKGQSAAATRVKKRKERSQPTPDEDLEEPPLKKAAVRKSLRSTDSKEKKKEPLKGKGKEKAKPMVEKPAASPSTKIKAEQMNGPRTPTRLRNRQRQSIRPVVWPTINNPNFSEYIKCDVCEEWYHLGCVGVAPDDYRLEETEIYKCPPCEAGVSKTDSESPMKGSNAADMSETKCARPKCQQPKPKKKKAAPEENSFVVESFVGRHKKMVGGQGLQVHYLVKWHDYDYNEATWETLDSMNLGRSSVFVDEFQKAAEKEGVDLNGDFDAYIYLQKAVDAGWGPDGNYITPE